MSSSFKFEVWFINICLSLICWSKNLCLQYLFVTCSLFYFSLKSIQNYCILHETIFTCSLEEVNHTSTCYEQTQTHQKSRNNQPLESRHTAYCNSHSTTASSSHCQGVSHKPDCDSYLKVLSSQATLAFPCQTKTCSTKDLSFLSV